MIQEHIKKPLADEVLFGKLKGGGHVRVVLVKDEASTEAGQEKIRFEYIEGRRSARSRRNCPARASAACRASRNPSGSSAGRRRPGVRGPLVKV